MTKAPNQTMKANGPIAMQVDSFAPAHSAFGVPIYVAPLPAGSIQRVCHDTLDFIQVPGYPSAIRLFALTHSRRIVVQR
jgi:hypothetical protein